MKKGLKLQWIKGDDSGTVEIVKEIKVENNIEYIIFESGRRINKSIILEYMFEIMPGDSPLDIDLKNHRNISKHSELKIPKEISVPINPIRTLLDKQKKLQTLKISHTFNIKIPPKALYQILEASFEDDVLNEILIDVDKQIESIEFKEKIKTKIVYTINSHYESKTK